MLNLSKLVIGNRAKSGKDTAEEKLRGTLSVEEKQPFYEEANELKEQLYKAHLNYKYSLQKKPAVHVSEMTPTKPAMVITRSVLTQSVAPNLPPTSKSATPINHSNHIPKPNLTIYDHCRQPTASHDYCFEYPRTSGVVIREGQEFYGSSYLPVWF